MSQNEAPGIIKFPLEEVKYSWKKTPGGEIKRVFTCDFWKDEDDWKKGVNWRKAPVSLLQKRSEEIDKGEGHVICLIGKLKSFEEDGKEAEKGPTSTPTSSIAKTATGTAWTGKSFWKKIRAGSNGFPKTPE